MVYLKTALKKKKKKKKCSEMDSDMSDARDSACNACAWGDPSGCGQQLNSLTGRADPECRCLAALL